MLYVLAEVLPLRVLLLFHDFMLTLLGDWPQVKLISVDTTTQTPEAGACCVSATRLTSPCKTGTLSFTLCSLGSIMWLHAGQCDTGKKAVLVRWLAVHTSLGTLVLSNVIQYNNPTIKTAFTKIDSSTDTFIEVLIWLCLAYVCSDVELGCILQYDEVFLLLWTSHLNTWEGKNIRKKQYIKRAALSL